MVELVWGRGGARERADDGTDELMLLELDLRGTSGESLSATAACLGT